jgi:hypothetical protein
MMCGECGECGVNVVNVVVPTCFRMYKQPLYNNSTTVQQYNNSTTVPQQPAPQQQQVPRTLASADIPRTRMACTHRDGIGPIALVHNATLSSASSDPVGI